MQRIVWQSLNFWHQSTHSNGRLISRWARLSWLLIWFGWVTLTPSLQAEPAAKPMNVLFLISDDLNTQLGCYQSPVVQSPHIDRLAARGTRFDRAYCQFPLCNPSRASLLTGRRPDHTQVQDNGLHFRKILPDVVTLPQVFKNQGYQTARIGKLFHYGVPGEIGQPGLLADLPSWHEIFHPRGRDKDEEKAIFSLLPGKFGGTVSWMSAEGKDEEQTDGRSAGLAAEWLQQHRDQPFFLAVGFYRPHTPYVAPKKYFDLYPPASLGLAEYPADDTVDIPKLALPFKKEELAMSDELRRQARQAYFASITFMDAQVGRVLQSLDDLNLADRTIVVMTSDHGYHLGEHGGYWQKQSLFEESARVPLIIAVPGQKPAVYEKPVELIDLYPTLAELCQLSPPAGYDGESLRPCITGDGTGRQKEYAISQVRRGKKKAGSGRGGEFIMGYSIRTPRYRYTEWDSGQLGLELYDHQKDPHEFTNLSSKPEFKTVLAELQQQLHTAIAK